MMQSNFKVGEFYKTRNGGKAKYSGISDRYRRGMNFFTHIFENEHVTRYEPAAHFPDGTCDGNTGLDIIGPWKEPEAETPAQKDAREGQELLKMGGGKATEKSTTPSVTPDEQRFWDQAFIACCVASNTDDYYDIQHASYVADIALAKRRERFG